jgi:ABC-2 type transport system permease protein
MLKGRIKKIFFYRNVLLDMAIRELRAKYSGSKLGIWWAVITPLILAVSINFIFSRVFKVNIPNYILFVLSGILPWIFFSNTLSEVTNSFIVNTSTLKQAIFPREFIPLSTILANFLNFFIGFLIILPLFIILNFKVITVLPFLIFPLIFHLIFIIGLGLLFSCLNVFSRDLSHLLSIGLMIWFWITPIFYSLDMLPFPYRWICLLNPVSYYVILYRQILYKAEIPPLPILGLSFLIALISFLIGYSVFLKKEAELLKRV